METHRAISVPLQEQGPQLGVIVPELTKLIYALIVAEPAAAPCCRSIDRREKAVSLTPLAAERLIPPNFHQRHFEPRLVVLYDRLRENSGFEVAGTPIPFPHWKAEDKTRL